MSTTVWVLTLLLVLLPGISHQDYPWYHKGKTPLRSALIRENNMEDKKEWNVKQTFESRKSSKQPKTMAWQNPVKTPGLKVVEPVSKDGRESKSQGSMKSQFDLHTMKWDNFKSSISDSSYRKDEKETKNHESLDSTSEYQAKTWESGKTVKLEPPISTDSRREIQEKSKRKKIRRLLSKQESSKLQTRKAIVQHFRRRHLVRNKRFSLSPSSSLPCSKTESCKKRCSSNFQVSYNEELICYCDILCEFFQDCCFDFNKFCQVSNGFLTEKNNTNLPQIGGFVGRRRREAGVQSDNSLWNWYNMTDGLKRTKGIWMIGSCPQNWQNNDVYYQCKNLANSNKITLDNYQYLPVYTNNGIVYHNQFCAQCNGVSLQKLKPYQLSLSCSLTPPAHLSDSDKLKFLFDYCSKIAWKPKQGDPRRYSLKIVSSCKTNISTAECNNTKARIVVDSACFYKNEKCAECNGKNISQIKCGRFTSFVNGTCSIGTGGNDGSFAPKPKPISIIFDFNNPKLMTVKCKNDHIFDDHLGACRKTFSLVPRKSEIEEYRILIWLKEIDSKSGHQVSKNRRFNNSVLVKEIAQALKLFPRQIDNMNVDTEDVLKIEFDLKDTSNAHSDVLQKILNFSSPFNLTLGNALFVVINAAKRATQCVSMQLYQKHEFEPANSSTAVHIKNTGEFLRYEDYYNIENLANHSRGILANHSRGILVCRKIAKCSGDWVLLEENEFTVMANRSLFVKASKILYGTLKQLWKNRTVYICYQNKRPPDDEVLSLLTTICMSLSIFALVFVLITYSLFAELRTPPGINLMNLSVSILLAQLLWQIGSGLTDKRLACTTIAVLLHYFFLVSFVWTSIIAFDTWRAFQCSNAPNRMSVNNKRCLRAFITGWVFPILYIIICIVLDTTNTVNIGYQSTYVCWMSNLYYFAVPMGCILLVNIIVYSLTLKAIKTATAQARAAVHNKHNTKLFGIYLRIASIMGFTWVSGFLISVNAIFSYFFVILSSLQGLYIALSFGLNQRARRLYADRLAFLTCTSLVAVDNSSRSDTRQPTGRHDVGTIDTKL